MYSHFLPTLHIRVPSLPAILRPVLTCLLTLFGVLLPSVEARTQDLAGDKAALEALYNATGGDNWSNNKNWLSDEPVGSWHGVTLTNGRVARLSLESNDLTGALPTQLGNLANLVYLNLSLNQLTGPIPSQLGNLANLESLLLSNNRLTGSIPVELGNLANLEILKLSRNRLTGFVPVELGNLANLRWLWLTGNRLTGPAPAELGNLTSLEILRLGDNQLTGSLPRSLTNLESMETISFNNGPVGLCAPRDSEFQDWLQAIPRREGGPNCSADNYSIPAKTTLTYPKAGSTLDDLIARVASGEISAEDAAAEAPLHRGDAVAVTLYLSGNVVGVASFLQNNGVTPRNQGDDYIEAFVPIRLLGAVSQQTGVFRIRMIQPPQENRIPNNVPGNGPPVHGSLAWNEAGYDGQGVRVGVIDAGFIGLSGLLGTELPASVSARCYTYSGGSSPSTNPADCERWDTHGTVVAESVLDIAPGVELFISQPQTQGDLRDAVEWMALQGVDVINYSMTWFFDGPGDGTSLLSVSPLKTVDWAVSKGIAWINSAGNDAQATWFKRAPFSPDVINFEGADSTNAVVIPTSGGGFRAQLRWDDSWHGANRDLDLCIGDPATGTIVRCTADPQTGVSGQTPFESTRFGSSSGGQYDLVVVRRAGTEPGWIQLTLWASWTSRPLEHATENGSIGNPGESANPGMLTVGAAHWNNTNTIESYSSQGPLPDGRVKPDLVGAACGETETWNRGFCGTSQSSPHVAGMAALVRQRFPQATPAQIAAYLKDNAEQRVTSPDPNNTWGHGFAVLPPVSPHNISCTNGTTVPNPAGNPDLVRDCETLLSARDELQGTASLNWFGNVPITMWEGISVGGSPQRVTTLALNYKQLAGTIPAGLGNLAGLERLWLTNNQLTGSIPSELGGLASLRALRLEDNQLTGTISSELGNLANLGDLDLTGNRLTGPIPSELGNLSNLNTLSLGSNQLTGSIPPELGKLTNLEALYLPGNQLAGTIPTQLGGLSNLAELALSDNQLTGTLPQSFTKLRVLGVFHFNLNPGLCAQDTGPVRTWLNGVEEVQGPDCSPSIRLSVNPSRFFEGAGATPVTVVAERKAVSNPTTVDLRLGGSSEGGVGKDYTFSGSLHITIPANMTSGTTMLIVTPLVDNLPEEDENIIIEAVLGNKTEGQVTLPLVDMARACAARDQVALEALYNAAGGSGWTDHTNWGSEKPLSNWYGVAVDRDGCVTRLILKDNQLTGTTPSQLGNLANLQELRLQDNRLTGPIPTELGNLTNLRELHLDNNQLTGIIPAELGNLANLQILLLGRNQLTGFIPAQMGNLANLRQLSLSKNQLQGNIPAELGNLASLWKLSLNTNQLTGNIPAQLGNLANLRELYLDDNQLTGSIPTELGGFANLTELWVSDNQLTGNIPRSFTQLAALERFFFHNNSGLCAQADPDIRNWLSGLAAAVGPDCALSSTFVPVILTASGRSNSFFTSELTLTNRGSQTATLRLHLHGCGRRGRRHGLGDSGSGHARRSCPTPLTTCEAMGIPIPCSG